jgi:hypothetical protein
MKYQRYQRDEKQGNPASGPKNPGFQIADCRVNMLHRKLSSYQIPVFRFALAYHAQ